MAVSAMLRIMAASSVADDVAISAGVFDMWHSFVCSDRTRTPRQYCRAVRAYRMLKWEQPPEIVDVAIPTPGPGEVVVKVAGNGLCHSDLIMTTMPQSIGEAIGWQMPFTLGHETAGWVHAVGAGVSAVQLGDAVACMSPTSCGACEECVRGFDNCCENGIAGRGYGRDGGLAEYLLVRNTRELITLRSLDPVIAGVLTDAGATSYHAVKRVVAKLIPGSTAVVIGAGGLGSFAVQFLRVLSPARVIVVDNNAARRDYALELGCHDAIDGVDDNTARALRRAIGGRGAHAVLDFVGIDSTIAVGLGATRPTGAFGLIGAGGGTLTSDWTNHLPKGGEVFTFQGPTIADTREVIALAEAGLIRVDVDRFRFDQISEAYDALAGGKLRGRAVVVM